jgi:hypothetical protein
VGIFIEDTKGNSKTEKIYDDSKVEDIESLEDQQPHRLIDLEIVAADREGDVLWSSTIQISNLPLSQDMSRATLFYLRPSGALLPTS